MDPIKNNPVTSAVIGGGLLNQFGIPLTGTPGDRIGQNFLGDLLSKVTGTTQGIDTVIGGGENNQFNLGDYLKGVVNPGSTSNEDFGVLTPGNGIGGNVLDEFGTEGNVYAGTVYDQAANALKQALPQQLQGIINTNNPNLQSADARDRLEIEKYKRRNLQSDLYKAIAGGAAAGAATKLLPKDTLAADNTGINFQTAQQVMDDPNQRFKPPVEATQLAANGGRIGYGNGTPDPVMPENFLNDVDKIIEAYMKSEEGKEELMNKANQGMSMEEILIQMRQELDEKKQESQGGQPNNMQMQQPQMQQPQMAAMGGRIGYDIGGPAVDPDYKEKKKVYKINPDLAGMHDNHQKYLQRLQSEQTPVKKAEGGLMDLGGNEMDLRAEGGFIPIGGKEKADDVPARLSKNEFVFTADAVRNAGGGDIDEGAQVMERLMKSLEQGGEVSEESQGLDGAREMFETSQRLEKRII